MRRLMGSYRLLDRRNEEIYLNLSDVWDRGRADMNTILLR